MASDPTNPEPAPAGAPPPGSESELPPGHVRALAFLIAGAFFMEMLDATIITTAVPEMARTFRIAPVDLNTGVSAYMLALGVFIPASGWIADRFGTRRVFATAIVIFTLASALCATANGLGPFVAYRILQGIGGAMMVPIGRLIMLKVTPKDQFMNAIATLTWPALIAPVLGPPIGGFITTYASWPWIFYLNLPLGLIAFLITLKLVPEIRAETVKRFDVLGFVLTGAGLAALSYGAELTAETKVDWILAGALMGGGALLLIAAVQHLKRSAAPMIDLGSMRIPTFSASILGGTFLRAAISAVPFLLPLMFQLGFGLDPFRSGLLLVAVFVGNLVMKTVTTPIIRRFGLKPVLLANGSLNVVCLGTCALFTPQTPYALIVAALFVSGLTRSLQMTALSTIAFVDVPKTAASGANALFATSMQLSMGLGVTLGAIALRVGQLATRLPAVGELPVAEYRVAFLIVAVAGALSLFDVIPLRKDAGQHITRA